MKEQITNFDSLLSPLEADVLKILWPNKKMRVKEILLKLKSKKTALSTALSSIAVICDRLHEKGLLKREIEKSEKDCIRYVYYPSQDKNNFEKSVIDKTVNKLIQTFGQTAVSYFNERFKQRENK